MAPLPTANEETTQFFRQRLETFAGVREVDYGSARPLSRHPGFFQDDRWLALHPFPHVAQSRRAAGEACQSTGEGLARFA
jgi:hypothetical protein